MTDFIRTERHDAVLRIVLNRPEARNAQNREMLAGLDAAFAAAADDDSVRVVILAGAGAHFSAGHDLKQAQAERADFTVEQRWDFESRYYYDYCLRIFDHPKPVIAEIRGACIAAGFMVANMCDLIVASETAFFADPVCHSLGAAAVEVLVHPWVLGSRKAREFLYTGSRLTAQAAEAAGMVNRVVPDPELETRTLEFAARIAAAPPFALRLVKRSINRTLDAQGFRTALAAHFDTHQLSHVGEAFRAARDSGLAGSIRRET